MSDEQTRVLALYKAGKSKMEIARELGKDKVWVKNTLADIFREKPRG